MACWLQVWENKQKYLRSSSAATQKYDDHFFPFCFVELASTCTHSKQNYCTLLKFQKYVKNRKSLHPTRHKNMMCRHLQCWNDCKTSELMYIKVHPKDCAWDRENTFLWNECVGGVEGFCITQAYFTISLFNWNVDMNICMFFFFLVGDSDICGVQIFSFKKLRALTEKTCIVHTALIWLEQVPPNWKTTKINLSHKGFKGKV